MVALLALLGLFVCGPALAETRVIHVLVALCDNATQGIVPVPAKIGNGGDPANNLYWGCAYGVSTFMKKQSGWRLVQSYKNPAPEIYERLVFKSVDRDVYMVADAYAGRHIKQTTTDLFDYAAGMWPEPLEIDGVGISIRGGADLLVYVGHNGLMDFEIERPQKALDDKKRDVAVFACASRQYFSGLIAETGARPLALTTNLMAPEAYVVLALAEGWVAGESAALLHERIAKAYNQYQKCGINGARKLFAVNDN